MAFRRMISKVVFPSLEKDLSFTIGKEVSKMDCVLSSMAPTVYGYVPKVSSVTGAFGSTSVKRQGQLIGVHGSNVLLQKVDIPFKPRLGLFHEF